MRSNGSVEQPIELLFGFDLRFKVNLWLRWSVTLHLSPPFTLASALQGLLPAQGTASTKDGSTIRYEVTVRLNFY